MASFGHKCRCFKVPEMRWHCGHRGCPKQADLVCSYQYLNQAKHVHTVELHKCRKHARRWCDNHKIQLPHSRVPT